MAATTLIDTNILVYAIIDNEKGDCAREIVTDPHVLSVQALNEFAHVARRKLQMSWAEIHEALDVIRARAGRIISVSGAIHDRGLQIAERYNLAVYDGIMIAAGLLSGCDRMLSEDMHDGLVIDGLLTIANPFNA